MTAFDWILLVVCWSLIPAVLILKAVLDHQAEKGERECWRQVDEILKLEGR